MKKIFAFIVAIVVTLLGGCQKVKEKILLETEVGIQSSIELDDIELHEKLDNEDSFILYIYVDGCTSCLAFSKQVLNPFIKTTGVRIYSCKRSVAKSFIEISEKEASPLLVVFNNARIINKTSMVSEANVFNSIEGFETYLNKYFVISKMKYISEEQLDLFIEHGSILVYFSWNECGDCKSFDFNFMNKYLLDNKKETYFYKIETAPFREDKDEWFKWKEKYGLTSYNEGRVPSLVYYEDGKKNDMAVYLNDLMEMSEEGIKITGSYYKDAPFIGQTYKTYDEYKSSVSEFHNQKIEEFLEKYYK